MQNRDTSVAAAPRGRPAIAFGLTVAMVAGAALCTALASMAGCGQKGPLFLSPGPAGAATSSVASSSPAGAQGTDPLSTPSTDPIQPPVTFPASPAPAR